MDKFQFKVETREHERGWGHKQIDEDSFNTFEEAVEFIEKINSKNTAAVAPDWYLQARPLNFKLN